MALLAFLITIGVLVIVHEFGHYLVARAFKVKIITFSVGFGPKIIKFRGKYNDWTVGLIPLGGYVRMLDEREGYVKDEYKHLAFNTKKPYQKILIALAGPAFNILFAVIIYYMVALAGVSELKPIVASIDPEVYSSIFKPCCQNSGSLIVDDKLFKPDVLIDKINGQSVATWDEADRLFNLAVKKSDVVKVAVSQNDNTSKDLTLDLRTVREHYDDNMYLETLGLYPYTYLSKIAYVEPNSPAYRAGLKVGDQIIGINGIMSPTWFDISKEIKKSVDKTVDLTIKRDNYSDLLIKLKPVLQNNDGVLYGKIGIIPTLSQKVLDKNSFVHRYGVLSGLTYAIKSCYAVISVNLSFLGDVISGKVSATNLGGPIAIAKIGSVALNNGFKQFADFLALISLGLAVMNLLPIPVLDGGHIVIYALEWFMGKEMSYKTQMLIFKIGFILVITVIVFAVYNDILRL